MSESEQIEKLLRQFYAEQDKVRGYVFAATRNYHVTEEILQSVAIVVAQKAATFEADRPSMPWFMGIARNNILKWYRSNQREACNVSFDVLDNCIPHMDSFAMENLSSRQHALENCLKRLPRKQRHVIELRYIENHDCSQIAAQLGRSIQSIYGLLKRVKLELRKCVDIQLQKEEPA
jgi:RNA polymerase sigma-70 factor (ECF subfamily)